MQRQLLVSGVEKPEAAGQLEVLRRLGPELELGTVDPRLRRVCGAKPRPLPPRQCKRIEELLVAIVVVKDRNIEGRPPLPELELAAGLVRIEPLRLSEGELCRRIECLPVEGGAAIALAKVCVNQYLLRRLPVDTHLTAGVAVIVLERWIDSTRRPNGARVPRVGEPGHVGNCLRPKRGAVNGSVPRRGR